MLVPRSKAKAAPAGYSGTPLPRKLGIGPDFLVQLIGAPKNFERTLGPLEKGARLSRSTLKAACTNRRELDLALWFVESEADLRRGVLHFFECCPRGGVWIIWRKKSAMTREQAAKAITESQIREIALAAGLVDFKVCALDATWSGLKFTLPKATKAMRK